MQKRLLAIGLRPINALVDVTNFFTFDIGRPLHVFDAAKLEGGVLTMRQGRPLAGGGETFAGLHGKAPNFSENLDDGTGAPAALPNSRVDLLEVDGWYTRGDLTLNGQISWGRQSRAAIGTATGAMVFDAADLRDAEWSGLSALVAYKLTPRLEGIVRGDAVFNKKNGGGLLGYTSNDAVNGIGYTSDPNVGANRYALSVGLNMLVDENTTVKTEYRLDRASQAVFQDVKSGTFKRSNNLLGASVVVAF